MTQAGLSVFAKELREALRDRRSILSSLAATLAGPMLVGVALAMLAGDLDSGPLHLSVAGAERAPSLMQRLREEGAVMLPAAPDVEADVRAGRVNVALVVPEDYPSRYGAVRTAPVRVISDPTRGVSREAAQRLRDTLSRYGRQIATVRLIARGINPEVMSPLRIEDIDVSTERARAAVALNVLPVFLLVSTFAMGMSVAIDATAGERERRTLEPLLLTGAAPMAIGAGKWAATATLNTAGLMLTLVCTGAILTRLPLEDLGVRLDSLGALSVGVLIAGAPLAFLAAALQVWTAAYARTFKEGQTYLSMLLFMPMVVGMLVAFSRAQPAAWRLAVPVLGQHQLLTAALRGEEVSGLALAVPAVIAAAVTAVLLRRIAVLLSSDRILYGQ